jgi:hypothetical protein
MKKLIIALFALGLCSYAGAQLKMPGVNWEGEYSFDRNNKFEVEFFDKKGKLRQKMNYEIFFQSNGRNFDILLKTGKPERDTETIMDLENEVAVQIFGPGTPEPMYNATKFKYPSEKDMKMMEIVPASETKKILGKNCKRYTYTYKKISGEAWITTEVDLSNDYGIFRASKMSSLHNTLSVNGFVMELTSVDAKGAKTVMKTVSLLNREKHHVSLKDVNMGTSINKANYFSF